MQNFQGGILMQKQTYKNIFKSAFAQWIGKFKPIHKIYNLEIYWQRLPMYTCNTDYQKEKLSVSWTEDADSCLPSKYSTENSYTSHFQERNRKTSVNG